MTEHSCLSNFIFTALLLTVAVSLRNANTIANTCALLSVTRLNRLTFVLLSRFDQWQYHIE